MNETCKDCKYCKIIRKEYLDDDATYTTFGCFCNPPFYCGTGSVFEFASYGTPIIMSNRPACRFFEEYLEVKNDN